MRSLLEVGAGVLGGAALTGLVLLTSGRGRGPVEAAPAERPASVIAERAEVGKLRSECEDLRAKASRAPAADPEVEIRELQSRIDALERKAKPASRDRVRTVLEIFSKIQQRGGQDLEETLKALALIREMDASDTSLLIEEYRNAKDPMARANAFTLAFYGGGEPAAGLLKEWLADDSVPAHERANYLMSLGAMVKGPGTASQPGYKAFPVDAELLRTAQAMAESPMLSERSGATFILAFSGDADSAGRLHQMAQYDESLKVRMAAVRALAVAGGRDTAAFLQGLPLPPAMDYSKLDYSNPEDVKKLEGAGLREAVMATIQELQRRFPK